jgi:hypothetical protein
VVVLFACYVIGSLGCRGMLIDPECGRWKRPPPPLCDFKPDVLFGTITSSVIFTMEKAEQIPLPQDEGSIEVEEESEISDELGEECSSAGEELRSTISPPNMHLS